MITHKKHMKYLSDSYKYIEMTFREYIETFNKKKKKKKKRKVKEMDRLYNPDQSYLTHNVVIPNYPQVTQPAGGPVSGIISGR